LTTILQDTFLSRIFPRKKTPIAHQENKILKIRWVVLVFQFSGGIFPRVLAKYWVGSITLRAEAHYKQRNQRNEHFQHLIKTGLSQKVFTDLWNLSVTSRVFELPDMPMRWER